MARENPAAFFFCRFAFWIVASVLLSGCAAITAQPETSQAEALPFIRQGDAAYERMAFEAAWEAYRKAETAGARSGVVFYRMDTLNAILRKSHRETAEVQYRKETRRLLDEEYRGGKGGPAVYFYLAQLMEGGEGSASHRHRLYAEAVRKFESGGFERLETGDMEKLGRMYQFLGLPEKAEKLFLQAQAMDSRNAFAAYGLGQLYRQAGRHRAALAEFERFTGIVPDDKEGRLLLGETAYALGQYARAEKAFETALALGPAAPEARNGLRRAREALERRGALQKEQAVLAWDTGFKTRLLPLTLPSDGLRLSGGGLGPPAVSGEGDIAFAAGEERRFNLYTLSGNGVDLARRISSSSGFTSFEREEKRLMVTVDIGPRLEVGAFDIQKGTMRVIHRGECQHPYLSERHRALLCGTPGGVLLVDPVTGHASTVFREPRARHPRLGGRGQTIILAERGEVIWLDRTGQEQGRHRIPGQEADASYPDFSPDGLWIVSGESGLHLTSVKEKVSVPLDHPALEGAGRAAFDAGGGAIVFVREGRLYRLELPKEMEGFFALQHARVLIRGNKPGAAARLLKNLPSGERGRFAYQLLLGEALMGLNVHEEAEASLNRAGELEPKDWRAPFLIGKLRAARKDWAGALRSLDRAAHFAPERYEVYLARAQAHASAGRRQAAAQDYQAALRHAEKTPGVKADAAVLGLLDAYVREGRIDEALLLLIDRAGSLSPQTLHTVRTAARYQPLQRDSRLREILGLPREAALRDSSEPSSPAEPVEFIPYRANVFIDDNPSPVPSEVISEEGGEVTIRAFGIVEKYPRGRLRIVR